MKRMKQLWAILLVIVLIGSCFVGCGKSNKKGADTTTGSQTVSGTGNSTQEEKAKDNPFAEPMEFSIANAEITDYKVDDELAQYYFEKFNFKIKPVPVTMNDYKEKGKIWAASGELPDVFTYGITGSEEASTYRDWIDQKIIRALPDDLSAYPNVQVIMSQPDVEIFREPDGRFYFFAISAYGTPDGWASDRNLYVRKDWMEKLGFKDPQNFDEFITMCKAFAENDPDGNNKADTIGFAPNFYAYMAQISLSTDLPNITNGSWVNEDGKWIPYYASPKYIEYLRLIRRMYKEGALDKDFAIRKNNEGGELFSQGKIGCMAFNSQPKLLKQVKDNFEKNTDLDFFDSVKVLRMWPNSQGDTYHYTEQTYWTDMIFNAKTVDDKKMDRFLRFLDYANSDEGIMIKRYGIPEKDFKVEDGKPVILREKNADGTYPELSTVYPSLFMWKDLPGAKVDLDFIQDTANYANFGEEIVNYSASERNYQLENTKTIPTNFAINLMNVPAKANYSITMKDEVIKVVLGKEDPEKMWKETLERFNKIGLQDVINQVNEKAQELGIK